MNETPQEYTKHIVGYLKGKQPLAVQAETGKRLEGLIVGVSDSKLRERPAPSKWSVNEILAHLADTEIVGAFRIRLILGAPGTPITGFDQDSRFRRAVDGLDETTLAKVVLRIPCAVNKPLGPRILNLANESSRCLKNQVFASVEK